MSEYIVRGAMPNHTVVVEDEREVIWHMTHVPVREQIVRCKDCKYMHTVRHWLGMDVDECWLHADRESGALGKERTEPDGFCAWGVRRADA